MLGKNILILNGKTRDQYNRGKWTSITPKVLSYTNQRYTHTHTHTHTISTYFGESVSPGGVEPYLVFRVRERG